MSIRLFDKPYLKRNPKKRKERNEIHDYSEVPWNVPSYILAVLQKNIKESKSPMSTWNFNAEKTQVLTPMASVRPVTSTAAPVVLRVSVGLLQIRTLLHRQHNPAEDVDPVVDSHAHTQGGNGQGVHLQADAEQDHQSVAEH